MIECLNKLFRWLLGTNPPVPEKAKLSVEITDGGFINSTDLMLVSVDGKLLDPPEVVVRGCDLSYIMESEYQDYNSSRKIYTATTLENYLEQFPKVSHPGLVIECRFKGRYLLMLDCDNVQDCNDAVNWCVDNGFNSAYIESSRYHYWVIVDKTFDTFKQAIELGRQIPGCDLQYLSFADYRNVFQMRAELCHLDYPRIRMDTCEDTVVREFLDKVMDHFDHPIVHQIYETRLSPLK
jgi:hypothetical protein